MENTQKKNTVVEFIIKTIRRLAFVFLFAALGYLGNNGELGANTVTAVSAISPLALVIVTYIYDLLAWVMPKAIVTLIWNQITKYIGSENVTYLKTQLNEQTPQALANEYVAMKNDLAEMKETLALIREDQLKVTSNE